MALTNWTNTDINFKIGKAMGSLDRKLRRNKRLKERKSAQKKAKQVENQVNSMPKTCAVCNSNFDNTDKDMLNQWRIAVWDDGRIELTCPNCGPTQEEINNSIGEST